MTIRRAHPIVLFILIVLGAGAVLLLRQDIGSPVVEGVSTERSVTADSAFALASNNGSAIAALVGDEMEIIGAASVPALHLSSSASGHSFVWTETYDEADHVRVLSSDGESAVTVWSTREAVTDVIFAPDDSAVFLIQGGTGATALKHGVLLSLQGTQTPVLLPGTVQTAQWSSDSRFIVVTGGGVGIVSVSDDMGSADLNALPGLAHALDAAFRDERTLILLRQESGATHVSSLDLFSGNEQALMDIAGEAEEAQLALSPDGGRAIVTTHLADQSPVVSVLDFNSRSIHLLAHALDARWTREGDAVFLVEAGGIQELWRYTPATSQFQRVLQAAFTLSP